MTTSPADLLTQPVLDHMAALLDVQGVTPLLDCSSRHVYRLSDAGRMPALSNSAHWCAGRDGRP